MIVRPLKLSRIVKPRPHQQHVEATFDMLLRHVAGVDGALRRLASLQFPIGDAYRSFKWFHFQNNSLPRRILSYHRRQSTNSWQTADEITLDVYI